MPSEKDLDVELKRYYLLLNIFEKVIIAVEKEMADSNQWFSFCAKLARKQLGHLKSVIFNLTQDLIKLEIDNIQISGILDISVLYTNLRIQFDTYSTFYHIFLHEGDWSEKIIRFRLWQMDSLLSRQGFQTLNNADKELQRASEQNEIAEIYSIIENLDFYKQLTPGQKIKLVKSVNGSFEFANWKFDKGLLSGRKSRYSWKELSINTGIKPEIYNDMHDFTSMHVHSNYISILQNEQLTLDDRRVIRMVSLRLSCYLTSMFMDDLCARFESAKTIAESLNQNQTEIIKSFLKTGRLVEKIKYFHNY